jgi:hypothetical protein
MLTPDTILARLAGTRHPELINNSARGYFINVSRASFD